MQVKSIQSSFDGEDISVSLEVLPDTADQHENLAKSIASAVKSGKAKVERIDNGNPQWLGVKLTF